MYVYMNGEFMKKEEIKISPFDHGFLYGMGVFETFRVYNHHPFLFNDHFKRLNDGMRQLNIEDSLNLDDLRHVLQRLLEKNHLTSAYVRLNVSAGASEIGLPTDPYKHPTVIMFMKPLSTDVSFPPKEGVIVQIKRNSPEGDYRLKSHHYLNNILAKREVGPGQNKEGIFLTNDGYVAEGVVSNLFWVKDGHVYTSSLETGILNGITRQFVITCIQKLNLPFAEGTFALDHLLSAEEVFVTNSIQEIVPITNIHSIRFASEKGPITQKLLRIYHESCHHLWSMEELEMGDQHHE